MSGILLYIKLPTYLHDWVTHKLGDPVVFPPASPQNAVIRTYLRRRPADEPVSAPEAGLTAIAIPDSVAKPAEIYNDMGERGRMAVAEAIKDLFVRQLWSDLSPLEGSPVGLMTKIYGWCEANGIGLTNVDAVRQCFYRIRKRFSARGINLRYQVRKR